MLDFVGRRSELPVLLGESGARCRVDTRLTPIVITAKCRVRTPVTVSQPYIFGSPAFSFS